MKKPKWLQKGLCCALAICILLLGTGMAEPLTMESEFAQESLLSAEGRDISRLTLESIPDSLIQTVGIESAAEGQRAVALEASDADSLHSFTTVNEDGSRSVYSFAQPVKYVDQKTNRIEFIDNDWRAVGFFDSLFSGEAYVNASNDVRVAVSGDIRNGVVMEWNAQALDNEPEVSPQAGDELTQSAEGAQTVRQSVASSDDVSRDYTFRMTPQTEASARAARDPGSSYVRYDGAFGEGTRLEYKAAHRGVKENLVLERNPGVNEFCFAIEAPGLVPDVMQGDAICFQDAQTGEPVVTLSPPWATDSHTGESDELPVNDSESEISDEQTLSDGDNQAIQTQAQSAAAQVGADPHLCFNLGYRLEAAGEGKYRLTLTIDPDYLNDPTTVYPVVIDPTVFTYANDIPYVTLFSDGSRWDVLGCVGNASGKEAMMYFKMPNMSQYKYINPNNVVSASVVMTQRVGSEDNYAS